MKTCIYTLNYGKTINDNPCYEICSNSVKKYAYKVGADFIMRTDLISDKLIDYEHINYDLMSEKYHIYELLDYYDRVLYLDGDVLIKPDADNIFEECNNIDYLYMSNERVNGVEYDKQIEKIKGDVIWTRTNGHYDFYNAGVILISKAQKKLFEFNKDAYVRFEDFPLISDQPYLNKQIFEYIIPIMDFGIKYNAMQYFDNDGDFLHFANVHDRNERIKKYV